MSCGDEKGKAAAASLFSGARRYHLLGKYNIDVFEVEELIKDQGGRCAICKEREAEHVDHDHLSGCVRGILCSPCNTGMGQFQDDPGVIRQAIDYLERWQTPPDTVQEPAAPYILSVA